MGTITPTKIVLIACGLLALIMFAARGCGGGGVENFTEPWGGMSRDEWLAQKSRREQEEAKKDAVKEKAEEKEKKEQAQKIKEDAEAGKTSVNNTRLPTRRSRNDPTARRKPQPPGLPGNFADWKPEDYYAAGKTNDRRMDKAIRYLGNRHPDKKTAVQILLKLLAEPASDTQTVKSRRSRRKGETQRIEAIVVALADADTPEAWRAIERLAAGEMKTADELLAAVAAAEMLVERPSRENEDALLRTITMAGRSCNGRRAGDEQRREKILAVVKKSAAPSLRLRLAEYMIAADMPRERFDELWTCLGESLPENLMPQIAVYQCGRLAPETVESLEKRFVAAGGFAICRLLGAPLPDKIEKDADAAPDDYRAVAGRLWSADFAGAVGRRLLAIDEMDQNKELISLAAAIPDRSLRAALHRLLELHWDQEPKALESIAFGERAAPEPGFLMSVKMLPRQDPLPGDEPRSSSKRRADKRGASAKAQALLEARRQRDETARRWMAYSKKLTQAMCRQFREAALASPRTGRRAGDSLDIDAFPIKPHPNAEVVAAYKLDWPEDLKGTTESLAALSPLKVHYIRTAQLARPAAVVGYYRRQLPAHEEHDTDEGIWLDALDRPAGSSLARSIDVFVEAADLGNQHLANREGRTIVEVLVVQCDPVGQSPPKTAGK
ncbi:MAG: hypothetical protein JW959_11285 [Pirellulales bacterium]|nr:hypothetical protein [Pirellulales bacterium]